MGVNKLKKLGLGIILIIALAFITGLYFLIKKDITLVIPYIIISLTIGIFLSVLIYNKLEDIPYKESLKSLYYFITFRKIEESENYSKNKKEKTQRSFTWFNLTKKEKEIKLSTPTSQKLEFLNLNTQKIGSKLLNTFGIEISQNTKELIEDIPEKQFDKIPKSQVIQNTDLIDYIKICLKNDLTKSTIYDNLLNVGWQKKDIDTHFKHITENYISKFCIECGEKNNKKFFCVSCGNKLLGE